MTVKLTEAIAAWRALPADQQGDVFRLIEDKHWKMREWERRKKFAVAVVLLRAAAEPEAACKTCNGTKEVPRTLYGRAPTDVCPDCLVPWEPRAQNDCYHIQLVHRGPLLVCADCGAVR